MKISPGPWHVNHSGLVSGPAEYICTTLGDNAATNSRAIACLPELVEAARTLLVAAEKYVDTASPWHGDILRMRRILARIDGEDA